MFNKNFLLNKLSNNEQVIGTWNIINSPMLIDVIASSKLDFIIVDAEHGSFTYETAALMVSICEANEVSPIMRIGEINESKILRALDIGMHGIQIPNIRTSKDAENFIKFAKYPPVGNRGFSPFTKAGLYDIGNAESLPEKANANSLLIVNIEDQFGLENIGAIAEIKEIDIIFIGLFDLSKSLGLPGQINNKKVLKKLQYAIDIVHKKNKKIGSIASSFEMMDTLKEFGVDYITYSVDTGVIKSAFKDILKKFRE